ncbi:MAG: SAM-dependent chlorinase/fluorinase [Kiloniellales bacterium]|nr:SAM-dependent chlorinase/fluorinase [Kiloniellales bacterium]
MIVLFTDFGGRGPYLGQMRAVLARRAPEVPVVDLLSDAPAFDAKASAYLLAAYAVGFDKGDVFICVVDPGVGGRRAPLVVEADGRWYVGPDNGLLTVVARRAAAAQAWEIAWRPPRLSASFHGRDLFAPVAAELARGTLLTSRPRAVPVEDWPEDLAEIVYVDGYGNAITGVRAAVLGPDDVLRAGERRIARARTFCEVAPGAAFWYENANGLAEIAVNRGRADEALGLAVGSEIFIEAGGGPATSR